MANSEKKKAVKKAVKKTPAAKKSAAKKITVKKTVAKKAAPRKIVGPYAGLDPRPKQHIETVTAPVSEPEKITYVTILEKPSWRARLVTIFNK